MRSRIAILSICISLFGSRADPPPTIWKSDLRSPGSKWTVMAYTVQNGGFGSASIDTVVQLKSMDRTTDSGKPHDILAFSFTHGGKDHGCRLHCEGLKVSSPRLQEGRS